MTTNTNKRIRAPFSVPELEERNASVKRAMRALLNADLRPDDLYYLLDMTLWRFTEFDKNRYKHATRYRTPAVLASERVEIRHEHVVDRRWLVSGIMQKPAQLGDFLELAVVCIVTKVEDNRLPTSGRFGWDRYRAAQLEVIDTVTMKPADLDALYAAQVKVLDRLGVGDEQGREEASIPVNNSVLAQAQAQESPVLPHGTEQHPLLPRGTAWAARGKGVRSMPGGYDAYADRLRKLCATVESEHPGRQRLEHWLHEVLGVANSGSHLCVEFLASVGLIGAQSGQYSVGPWTQKWLETRDARYIVALLHSKCTFIGEFLVATRYPRSTEEVLQYANNHFATGWNSLGQVSNRRGWLQSFGMLEITGDRRLQTSGAGEQLLSEIAVREPLA